MAETLLHAFVTFLVILDPPGTAVLFASMTAEAGAEYRRRMAVRAVVLSAVALAVFALAGKTLLTMLGISLAAFKVAGGLLLFLLAADMVFARRSGLRGTTPAEEEETAQKDDISVFPLAFPLIAGPGAMTSVVLMMGNTAGDTARQGAVLAVLGLVMAMLLAMLLAAGRVQDLLGKVGAHAISRVLGIVLAALAVQFVLDGVISALG